VYVHAHMTHVIADQFHSEVVAHVPFFCCMCMSSYFSQWSSFVCLLHVLQNLWLYTMELSLTTRTSGHIWLVMAVQGFSKEMCNVYTVLLRYCQLPKCMF